MKRSAISRIIYDFLISIASSLLIGLICFNAAISNYDFQQYELESSINDNEISFLIKGASTSHVEYYYKNSKIPYKERTSSYGDYIFDEQIEKIDNDFFKVCSLNYIDEYNIQSLFSNEFIDENYDSKLPIFKNFVEYNSNLEECFSLKGDSRLSCENKMPTQTDEIAISDLEADILMKFGDFGEEINSIDKLIGKKLGLFTIVGIFESGENKNEFLDYLDNSLNKSLNSKNAFYKSTSETWDKYFHAHHFPYLSFVAEGFTKEYFNDSYRCTRLLLPAKSKVINYKSLLHSMTYSTEYQHSNEKVKTMFWINYKVDIMTGYSNLLPNNRTNKGLLYSLLLSILFLVRTVISLILVKKGSNSSSLVSKLIKRNVAIFFISSILSAAFLYLFLINFAIKNLFYIISFPLFVFFEVLLIFLLGCAIVALASYIFKNLFKSLEKRKVQK